MYLQTVGRCQDHDASVCRRFRRKYFNSENKQLLLLRAKCVSVWLIEEVTVVLLLFHKCFSFLHISHHSLSLYLIDRLIYFSIYNSLFLDSIHQISNCYKEQDWPLRTEKREIGAVAFSTKKVGVFLPPGVQEDIMVEFFFVTNLTIIWWRKKIKWEITWPKF